MIASLLECCCPPLYSSSFYVSSSAPGTGYRINDCVNFGVTVSLGPDKFDFVNHDFGFQFSGYENVLVATPYFNCSLNGGGFFQYNPMDYVDSALSLIASRSPHSFKITSVSNVSGSFFHVLVTVDVFDA